MAYRLTEVPSGVPRMEPEIELEHFAALCAEVEAGTPLEEVLRASGLNEKAWASSRDTWMGRMSGGSGEERVSLEGRYRSAFDARRRALQAANPVASQTDQEKPGSPEAPSGEEPAPTTARMIPDEDPPTPKDPRVSRRRLNTMPIYDEASSSGVRALQVGQARQPVQGQTGPTDEVTGERATPMTPTFTASAPPPRATEPGTDEPGAPGHPPAALPFRAPAVRSGASTTMAPPPSKSDGQVLPFRPAIPPAGEGPGGAGREGGIPFRSPSSPAIPSPVPQSGVLLPPLPPLPPPPTQSFRPPLPIPPPGPPPSLPYGAYPPPGSPIGAGLPGGVPASGFRPSPPTGTPPSTASTPLSMAGFPSIASGPRLGLEHYAAFAAEIAVDPASMAEIRARYGLTDATHTAESDAWQRRFAADRDLYVRYAQLFQRYRDWLTSHKER